MEMNLQMRCDYEKAVKEVFYDFFDEEPMDAETRSVMGDIIAAGPEALISIDDYNRYMEKQYMNTIRLMVAMALGTYKESTGDDDPRWREKVSKYFVESMMLEDADGAVSPIDGVQNEIIDNLFEMFSDSLDG